MITKTMRRTAAAALLSAGLAALIASPAARAETATDGKASTDKTPSSGTKAPRQDVSTLLFNTPQWTDAAVGTKIRYTFERTTSEATYGAPMKDEVVLTLGKGDDAQSRTVEMQLFSGANRRPAGPFRSDAQNPVLLIILEENVQELSKLFKANPRYLKNAIRKAWRDKPTIETVKIDVAGKQVDATRIAVTPFKGDKEADKMKGLDALVYTVDVSKDVPGYIATIDIRAPASGKPLLAETLRYASETAK